MSDQVQQDSWHLDKRVPLALILTSLLQIVSIVWIAAQMNADIATNKENIQRLDSNVVTLQREANAQAVQLGRIEEGISGMRRDMGLILDSLKDLRSKDTEK